MKKMTAARVCNKVFKTIGFTGDWGALIGDPATNFNMFIFGESGNGKTNFSIRLAKYLSKFKKVLYFSVEEGISKTIQETIIRQGLMTCSRVMIGEYSPEKFESPYEELRETLKKRNSEHFIFIDSLDYSDMNKKQLKSLIREFPKKSFIVIGRAEGSKPKGAAGEAAFFDLQCVIHVVDFTAYNVKPRYGGGEPYDMNIKKS